jgi:LuxR family maltose regulon positive regulatory protein
MLPRQVTRSPAIEAARQADSSLPPLVRLRVTPPLPDGQLLPRPRVQRLLERAVERRLTLLAAPAGFGKSAALSAWAAASPRRVAWIALGADEGEAALFAPLLAAAVRRAGVPLDWQAPPGGLAGGEARGVIALVLDAVAALDEPLTLVLDGYEAVGSPATHELLAFLLEHAPPGLRLIVASRGEPPLPLALLRARRQLAELRADDLRWNVAEVGSYLNGMRGLALAPAQVGELLRRTEGWATGLQLAALALEAQPDRAAAARHFDGTHRFVADYLFAEVLERQSEPFRSFLLHSAALDELSAPLLESALLGAIEGETGELLGGHPSGQAALEAAHRRDLFLAPIAGRPGWYRYHGLFAEAMRLRLEQLAPGRGAALRQRADNWLARGKAARVSGRAQRRRGDSHAGQLLEPLSERELEVLSLIAAGRPNREIASMLSISESTVKSHIKHVFAKLDARNRTEAVAVGRVLQLF